MINTVIFDLDGTLLDTLQDLADSVNYALKTNQLPYRTTDEIRMFLGNGYKYLITHVVPNNTLPVVAEDTLKTFKAYYQDHCFDTTQPYAGIIDMLKTLQEKKIKMAIVSNKGNDAVQELVPHFFKGLISIAVGESATVRRKPNPDTVLEAMEKLGSNKSESIYVGDSEVDYETAQNASISCVSCSWGFRSKSFLQQLGSTCIIDHPKELIDIL